MENANKTQLQSGYGTLGLDVGAVGRWSRLLLGLFYLVPITLSILLNPGELVIPSDLTRVSISEDFVVFYGSILLSFIGILVAYTGAYLLLGERVLARGNTWLNTVIFVGPAFMVAFWNITIGLLTEFSLPLEFVIAMGIYIGISFILQWKIEYGGCEVVAVPILLFKRRYQTYCIPLVALDVIEKKIIESRAK